MKKLTILLSLIILSSCSVNKQSLGLGRQNHDEFTVMKRRPLSMPPEYNLAPPEPGKEPLQPIKPAEDAETALFGNAESEKDYISNADQTFLDKLGTEQYHPNIRKILDDEVENDPANDKYLIDNVMFWKDKDNSVIIDNIEEAKRLKANKEQGLPVDNGDVKVFNPKD